MIKDKWFKLALFNLITSHLMMLFMPNISTEVLTGISDLWIEFVIVVGGGIWLLLSMGSIVYIICCVIENYIEEKKTSKRRGKK